MLSKKVLSLICFCCTDTCIFSQQFDKKKTIFMLIWAISSESKGTWTTARTGESYWTTKTTLETPTKTAKNMLAYQPFGINNIYLSPFFMSFNFIMVTMTSCWKCCDKLAKCWQIIWIEMNLFDQVKLKLLFIYFISVFKELWNFDSEKTTNKQTNR